MAMVAQSEALPPLQTTSRHPAIRTPSMGTRAAQRGAGPAGPEATARGREKKQAPGVAAKSPEIASHADLALSRDDRRATYRAPMTVKGD